MKFLIKAIDSCIKIKEKYNRPDFIIGYRLSPEEPYENGITITETLKLIKVLLTKQIQYIHISQWNYFRKAHRGEGAGHERLKIIHEITNGKMPTIGVGDLKTGEDLNKALDTGFSEFIGVGEASMMNKELGILLKENKENQINLELDPEHPEKYAMPKILMEICCENKDWGISIKGQTCTPVEFE